MSKDMNPRKIEDEDNDSESPKFRTYKKRWFVMTNLSLLNLSLATIWLGFSPVAYKASVYYDVSVTAINWLSIGVIVLGILFGFLWSWLLNRIGLKACMLISAWAATAGAGLRICSTIEAVPDPARLMLLFVGQYTAGIVQPLSLYCAPKMAALWFPSGQRSVATTLSGMANPVGIVLTGVISPLFVDQNGKLHTRYMLTAYAGLPLLCAIMTSLVMTSGAPPSPPSYGGTMTCSRDFFGGMKKVLRNKEYVILMLAVGSGIGLYSSFATLGEQVLCPWGYSDSIAGICSSTMTGAGLCGAIIMSLIVDRTKWFAQSLKFMFVSAAIATVVFTVTHKMYMGYFIALIMGLLGFLAFGIAPIGMETGAEVTFPVGVSIGTAMIQISGQFISTIMILVLQSIGRPMTSEELHHYGSKCHSNYSHLSNHTVTIAPEITTYDLTVSTYVISGIMAAVALGFLFLFRPTYRRMEAEQRNATLRIAANSSGNVATLTEDAADSSGTVATLVEDDADA